MRTSPSASLLLRPLAATGGPQPTDIQYKLTQSYRIATAVNAGSDVEAIRNANGQVELFTVGSDNSVWNFYPDPTSETGYGSVSLGIQASAIAVGLDPVANRLLVFVASGTQLFYLTETGQPTNRWSTPTKVPVALPPKATKIARVLTQQMGNSLYVAVLTAYTSILPNTYALAYSIWQTANPTFTATSFVASSLNCVWLGNSTATAAFACVDVTVATLQIATNTVQQYPMVGTFQSSSADAVTATDGTNTIVAVLADGNVHLLSGGNGQAYYWVALGYGSVMRQVRVAQDVSGQNQVFAVSASNQLMHWLPEATSQSGYSDAAVLQTNVAKIDVATNDAGAVDLFLVGTAHNTLSHLAAEEVSGNWVAEALEVPTNGVMEEFVAYATQVTPYDAAGAPLVNAAALVHVTEATQMVINGATYYLGPAAPVSVSTNGAGMLCIAQETSHLTTSSIRVSFPGSSVAGQPLALYPSANVKAQLAATTGPDLMNAKDASDNYLLGDTYRTPTTTTSVAQALNQCMQVNYASPTGGTATYNGPAQHWQLRFNSDKSATFQYLAPEQAHSLLAAKRLTLASPAGILDWLDDIGDFIEEVVDGIANIVDVVVTTVGNAVQAAITFVVDGVTYLFEAVASVAEQALDLAETILAQVKVAFEKLFEWLGYLFSWPDITRTHEALAYTFNEMFTFLQGATGGIQKLVDTGITNLQGKVDALFQQGIQALGAQTTLGGYADSNRANSPAFGTATTNNVAYNGLIDNASGASTAAHAIRLAAAGPFDSFMQQVSDYVGQVENMPAFKNALAYFQNLNSSPDQLFVGLLSGMLELLNLLVQAILAGVQAIVDALLQLVQTLIGDLQQLLTTPWDIPFVSQFYTWATNGGTLTALDLLALVVAVPTTPLYKLVKGSTPFPDQASVAAFKNSFSAATMLQAAGLGTTTTLDATSEMSFLVGDDPVIQAMPTLMAIGGAVATFFYGGLSAILDAIPKQAPTILSQAALVLETVAQVCAFPWFYTSGAPDCTTADGTGKMVWIYQNVGVLLDGAFVVFADSIPENKNDVGVVISFLYAVGHLVTGIVSCVSSGQTSLGQAAVIIPIIPEILKIGRLESIVSFTEGISLGVVAASDGLFYLTSAILNVAQVVSTSADEASERAPALA